MNTLIFVYNANSGKVNLYLDILHKIVSPSTYPCSLCATTYGTFKIREEWKNFKSEYTVPMRFLHKDEWENEFNRKDELPAIFLQDGEQLSLFLKPEQLNKFTLEELQAYLKEYERSQLGVGGAFGRRGLF
ncbi:MAG: hypothetical protein IPN72_19065 [Saprospiraceae bacterium]|nr:hypothetical protein [Saprospiraceae bacterium]